MTAASWPNYSGRWTRRCALLRRRRSRKDLPATSRWAGSSRGITAQSPNCSNVPPFFATGTSATGGLAQWKLSAANSLPPARCTCRLHHSPWWNDFFQCVFLIQLRRQIRVHPCPSVVEILSPGKNLSCATGGVRRKDWPEHGQSTHHRRETVRRQRHQQGARKVDRK